MSDEPINSLIPIQDGGNAEAKPLRQNFNYLDDRISSLQNNISNKESISNKNTAGGYCGLDNTGQVPNARLSTFKQGIDSQISSLNTQVAACVKTSGDQTVNGAKYFQALANINTPITTRGIAIGSIGCLRMGNGIIMQWGYVTHANNGDVQRTHVTFRTPFTSAATFQAVASWTMMPKVGDKGFCWAIQNYSSTGIDILHETAGSQHQSGFVNWIAIGS